MVSVPNVGLMAQKAEEYALMTRPSRSPPTAWCRSPMRRATSASSSDRGWRYFAHVPG
ncbi:hypothetical protein [Sodalis sp.]|uniref:hypothetical protein n=1 Tax=Sodalis sp. (in: enterobacteria) TaxID=1898979 RepID=UPI003873ABA3